MNAVSPLNGIASSSQTEEATQASRLLAIAFVSQGGVFRVSSESLKPEADISNMSTSFIEGAARDFDERLRQMHQAAMDRFELQDLVHLATNLGRATLDSFSSERIVPAERNISLQNACRFGLKAITSVRSAVNAFGAQGHEVVGVAEMDEVAVDLRFMLADLIDLASPVVVATPVSAGSLENTAPDSWFKEDHGKLRGPFGE